jgi:hypothetical protein
VGRAGIDFRVVSAGVLRDRTAPAALLLLVSALCVPSRAAAHEPALDAALRDTRDDLVRLSRFRGKPVVLIYEDRHSTEVNRDFKNVLRDRGQKLALAGDVAVVAIANVSSFNFFPVRGFALDRVRDVELRARLPILCDWEDALTRPPWNLPRSTSSVLVLSPEGEVVFRHSGRLGPRQQDEALAAVRRMLAVRVASP